MSARRTGPDRAFTLVEMLGVLLIIVILTAILAGTIVEAQKHYSKTLCAANLREIGSAHEIYVTDYAQYVSQILDYDTVGGTYTTTDYDWHLRLRRYLPNPVSFVCSNATESAYTTDDLDYGLSMGIYMLYNDGVLSGDPPVTPEYVKYPHQTVLCADSDDSGSNDTAINHASDPVGPAGAPCSEVSNRHNNGSNVLFADLHVNWLAKAVLDGGSAGGAGYLWDTGSGEP